MKKNMTVLRISGILALVIISCLIAGCMTSQQGTPTVTSTPAPAPGTSKLSSVTSAVSDASTATTETLVSGSDITLKNNDIQPAVIVINPGTTITVTNQDTVSHLLASDTGAPASFKTDKIPPGGSYTFTLTKSGYYTFRCILTLGPAGTIVVN